MELYLEPKPGEGKTYVDWSCADNSTEQEHMRNLGRISWKIQWKQFLAERFGENTPTFEDNK